MRLIKINEHFIIVSDEIPTTGDWVYDKTSLSHSPLFHRVWEVTDKHFSFDSSAHALYLKSTNLNLKIHFLKVLASNHPITNPIHNIPSIIFTEEIAKKIGWVDVGKLADEKYPISLNGELRRLNMRGKFAYIEGFNKAIELNKDKIYTEEDMSKIFDAGIEYQRREVMKCYHEGVPDCPNFLQFIQSLQPKTEWEIEYIEENNICKVIKIIE